MISPELAPTQIPLTDLRDAQGVLRFDEGGVEFATLPSVVQDITAQGWQAAYDAEQKGFLTKRLGTKEVIQFDHTLRHDDPDAARRPAGYSSAL